MSADLPTQLSYLLEENISDHFYVSKNDDLYYFGEYKSGYGYNECSVNSFISNFKKTPDRIRKPEWRHKISAIDKSAAILSETCKKFSNYIWVPVPSSKIATDPLHDDRLLKVLKKLRFPNKPRILEIITQISSREAHHTCGENRPNKEKLKSNYVFHQDLLKPDDKNFVIFDDVLTTGCHFRACEELIHGWKPDAVITGIFLARVKRDPMFAPDEDLDFPLP
ncbi:hypothetical protein ACLEIY_16235 [Acetobacter tropicalis]|uniref:hypothetical protein n=1 Tax=Acetobacter tropicalis TaxID=104102 RepID=UPI00397512A7